MRLIDADALFQSWPVVSGARHDGKTSLWAYLVGELTNAPTIDAVPVVQGYSEGDFCIYGFGAENKSLAIVEIVKILNDKRGVAEVMFHKVIVDDTGNGLFNYLLKSGGTMNASFKYLKNVTPRGERKET